MNRAEFIGLFVVATAMLSGASVALVRRLAIMRSLLDVPNQRSSHKMPIPRLGGAGFIPVVLLCVGCALNSLGAISAGVLGYFIGAIILFIASLADDIISLSSVSRFIVHVAVSTVFVRMVYPEGLSAFDVPIQIIWALGIVTAINIYNFMDGIDGIAGLQAVVGGLGWYLVASSYGAGNAAFLALGVLAGAVGFLIHNWSPAKIFMGDAGSTVLGFTFGALPLLVYEQRPEEVPIYGLAAAGVFIVWPFFFDGIFTIVRRFSRHENILEPHRSHLYQRLTLSGETHAKVALIYGFFACIGTSMAVMNVGSWRRIAWSVFGIACVSLLLWVWTLNKEFVARQGRRTVDD